MDAGRFVPCMPWPFRDNPIHRVPSGLTLPGGTILPLVYHVGSWMLFMILYTPAGLGDFGAPTATGKTFTMRRAFEDCQLAVGMLTTMRRARPRTLVLRERFGGSHQHDAGQGRQFLELIFHSEHLPILRTRNRDAGMGP